MISFRPLSRDDVPFLTEVRNECAEQYLHTSAKFSLDDAYKWFDKTQPMFYTILYNDVKIGYFRVTNYSEVNRNLYIGADLHKDYRGKGLAYEAYRLFIPFVIKQYNLHKVSLEVLASNVRAYNLYIKLGFVNEGVKREEVYKNGDFVGSIVMSILASEAQNNPIFGA